MDKRIIIGCKIKLIKNPNETEDKFYIYDPMRRKSAIVVSINEKSEMLEAVMIRNDTQNIFEYDFCNVKYVSNKNTYVLRQFETTEKDNYVMNVVFSNGKITTYDGYGVETYIEMRKKIIILLQGKTKFENDNDIKIFDYFVNKDDHYPLRFDIGCMEFTAKALKKVWNNAAKVCRDMVPIE